MRVNIVDKKSDKILETKTFSTVRQLQRYQNYFNIQCDTQRFRLVILGLEGQKNNG